MKAAQKALSAWYHTDEATEEIASCLSRIRFAAKVIRHRVRPEEQPDDLTVFMMVKTMPEWLGFAIEERFAHFNRYMNPILKKYDISLPLESSPMRIGTSGCSMRAGRG